MIKHILKARLHGAITRPTEWKYGLSSDERIIMPLGVKMLLAVIWFMPLAVFVGTLLISGFNHGDWVKKILQISFFGFMIQGLLALMYCAIWIEIKGSKAEKPSTRIVKAVREFLKQFVSWCGMAFGIGALLVVIGITIALLCFGVSGVASMSVHSLMVFAVILLLFILFK